MGMSETAYLSLLLDGTLQSWGFESRFQRRTTGLHPTKSGVIGIICAAMGLAKGSERERELLTKLATLNMTSVAIPRRRSRPWAGGVEDLPVRRLDDFHTVLGTRRASGKMNLDAVVTRRQYLQDARFGVILEGPRPLLEDVEVKLTDPAWGVWLGRKSCIPSQPVLVERCDSADAAWRAISRVCRLGDDAELQTFSTVADVKGFADGTDSLRDQPVSFGNGKSSGPDKRVFAVRRVRVRPASIQNRKSEL
jgi:CRISPR system Cascade subunit CasD